MSRLIAKRLSKSLIRILTRRQAIKNIVLPHNVPSLIRIEFDYVIHQLSFTNISLYSCERTERMADRAALMESHSAMELKAK